MPQSLSAVYVHLVFSTKERRPFFQEKQMRGQLHAYLAEISNRLDCPALKVGGVEDHVHLVCRLGRTITQSDWVKELKRISNLWIQKLGADFSRFQWQGGYADFSISASNLEKVIQYIENQEQHHRKVSFQDELRELLRKHKLEWDERYIWD